MTRALKSMSPQKFETFARGLVKEMGVKLDEKIEVSYTNDGGLDGFILLVQMTSEPIV